MPASTSPQLSEQERALIRSILRAHGVQHASLFGSYARGEQHTTSDIDLVVELPPGASLFDLSALGLALEDALSRKVDLVTSLDRLHPLVRERILHDQEVLLESLG
jgi:predicted nucleotidyltransferase